MSKEFKQTASTIAQLAVDALVDAGFVKDEDFDKAVKIVEEEALVRLILTNYKKVDLK